MPSQTFRSLRHIARNGPEILKYNATNPLGYLYTVFFKNGQVKMGASVRPAIRLQEQFIDDKKVLKITVSSLFENYREVELRLVKEFQIFLTKGWNGGPREIWKLPASVLEAVLKCYETGFTEADLLRIGELCDYEYEKSLGIERQVPCAA